MTLDSMLGLIQKYPFILAFILGLLPALIWLWFWLKEDTHPEPAKMITLSFLGGMVAVMFVFVYFIALRNKKVTEEPVDDIIYLIISALGFVTFENTLFLIPSISNGDFLYVVVHGNLRFVGASLLHIMSSGAVGICIALAFYKSHVKKVLHVISGLVIAIVLHTAFNLFIISRAEKNIFLIFGIVWIGIVGLLLMFEKVKHIKTIKNFNNPQN